MKKLDLKFEIRAMGKGFYIPIVIMVLAIIHLFFMMNNYDVKGIGSLIPKLEAFIVPSIGIWVILLFYEYYENKSLEILLSYPLRDREHIFLKVSAFVGIFILCLLPIFVLCFLYEGARAWLLILQIIPQVIFIAGVITIIIVLAKNTTVALVVLIGYVSIEFLTLGELMTWYHVFNFNNEILTLESLIGKTVINLICGVIFLVMASKNIR